MGNQVYANMMEVSCKAASGKSICAFPDVCFTPPQTPATPPGVPIPYPNTGLASDTTDGSSSVKISGQEVMLKNKSYFKKSMGDEAGVAPKKGVVTSKNMGKVYFNAWSMDVKVEGENVVRHLDITTHNHASAPGNSPPMPHIDEMAAGPGGDEAEACPICPSAGSPVNPILGAKVLAGEEDLDFTLEGPLPLQWQRTYRSTNTREGWFGRGWMSPLEVSLEAIPDQDGRYVDHIEYLDLFGRRVRFPCLERGGEFFSPHERLTLSRTSQGQYRLETSDLVTYWFSDRRDSTYRLAAVTDRNDNAIHLEYRDASTGHDSIRVYCSGKQELELAFQSGRLTAITELRAAAAGLQRISLVRYEYTAQGDLGHVINRAEERVRTFEYSVDRLMQRQVYAGTFEACYEYSGAEGASRVVRHWDNVGRSWTFEYRDAVTAVTDQDGRTTLYHFDQKRRWTGYTDARGQFTRHALDAHGNLRAIIDPAENVTETVCDERGNPIELRDAAGAVTCIEWHPTLALPVVITDPLNRTTRYEHDRRGNLVLETDPTGATIRYERDARGLTTAIEDSNGGIKRFRYNDQAQLTEYTDCSGRTTLFTYDANGWLICVTNALGERTTYAYDAAGRLIRQTLAEGSFEVYERDVAGRLLRVLNSEQAKTEYRYAADGLLEERIDALGNRLHYRHDRARRLVQIVNENGACYDFTYDALDQLIEEIRFDGTRTRYAYDRAGHLVQSVQAPETPEVIVTRFRRDPLGHLLERATATTRTEFAYDAAGQLTQAHTQPPDVKVRLAYDKAGRLSEESVATPDRAYTLRHAHDSLGNRLLTTLPDGTTLGTLYYGSGHVHQIQLNGSPITDIERDALHREVTRTQGKLITTRLYDAAGRLRRQFSALATARPGITGQTGGRQAHIDRQYRYDTASRLIAAVDRGKELTYGYDAIDQLTRFDNERFAFDPAHDLISPSSQAGGSAGLIEGNRLMVYEDKRYRYDAHGRVIEKSIGAHTVIHFKWNDEHRLVESRKEGPRGSCTTSYVYDPFGRRLSKQGPSGTTWFVWDGDLLTQESDEAVDRTYLYEPDSFVPLAQAAKKRSAHEQPGQLYYYHCDQIGLPRELTVPEGTIAWEGEYQAWGGLAAQRVDAGLGGRDAIAPFQPLRFQGQYCDGETGLHYNRYRYYDPSTARFISPDPIGLEGGENAYQYAPNPTDWLDPLGLWKRRRANGQFAAKPGPKKKKDSTHGCSLDTTKPAKGYELQDRDSGEVQKYGETTRGKARYTQAFLEAENVDMVFKKSGTKREMHKWQHDKIIEYKQKNGCRPRLNKSDY
jgi:RHS repeat-associated protein